MYTVVPFVFQIYPVFKFGKLICFGLGTVKSERVNTGLNLIKFKSALS